MSERERGAGRDIEHDRSETVAPPAGLAGRAGMPRDEHATAEALYRRQMAVGSGVQDDFDEALAELAK